MENTFDDASATSATSACACDWYAFIPLDGAAGKPLKIDMAAFWARVAVDTSSPHGCWMWQGGRNEDGYGLLYVRGSRSAERPWGRKVGAHRVSYLWTYGPRALSAEREVCHVVCDNPSCVHPGHLAAMTHQQNMEDCASKGRQWLQRAPREENPVYTHPERLRRGENHPQRLHPERAARGERQGSAKLREADVLEIRALFADGRGGWTKAALARRFGVGPTAIGDILSGRRWRHLLPAGPDGQRQADSRDNELKDIA